MKKWVKYILYLMVAGVLLIQFFRPERNRGALEVQSDMLTYLEAPPALGEKLKNACYDCHSNSTEYPWYSQVAPVSWILARHIREGKEEVNFSEFGNLEKKKMIGMLTELCEVVEEGVMPLPGYVSMHKEATFSPEEIDLLCEWSELEALKLLRD